MMGKRILSTTTRWWLNNPQHLRMPSQIAQYFNYSTHNSVLEKIIIRTKSVPFVSWYSKQLDAYPLLTKCFTAGVISGCGNILSQKIMHDKKNEKFQIDWGQTGRFVSLNMMLAAPTLHFWYNWLARAIPGTTSWAVIKRVVVDEFLFTPLYVPALMGMMWTMEGIDIYRIPTMISDEFWNVMMAEWLVYVPLQYLNFRYVPVKFQVLVINCAGVGWNCFICWRASLQQQQENKALITEGKTIDA